MIPHEINTVLVNLIKANVLPKTMSTKKVVRYLNNKEYHRAKLYKPEYKELLGRQRKGVRNFEFDTLKVIEFEMTFQGNLDFIP